MDWFKEYKELVFSHEINVENVNKAIKIKFENLPSTLFKYRQINDNSINNLEQDTIWLSDPRNFNDPYDCSFTTETELNPESSNFIISIAQEAGLLDLLNDDKIEEVQNSLSPLVTLMEHSYPNNPEHGKKIGRALASVMKQRGANLVSEISEGMKQAFKVCSFSEDPSSVLMWSHYAQYHQGFCIAYDFKELGCEDIRTRLMCPTIYSEKLFDASNSFGNKNSVNNILFLNQAALMKSKAWSYEKEWRLVFGNGTLTKEMPYKVPKPKFIILGTKISEKNKERITSICESKNIQVKQMLMSESAFELNF